MDNLISLIDKIGTGRLKAKDALEKIQVSGDTPNPVQDKVQKPEQPASIAVASSTTGSDQHSIKKYLIEKISEKIGIAGSNVETSVNFLELGLDSVTLIQMTEELEGDLQVKLYPTLFFEYQTIDDLSGYFNENFQSELQARFGSSGESAPQVAPVAASVGNSQDLQGAIEKYLKEKVSEKLQIAPSDIEADVNFLELGLDSVTLINLSEEIENSFSIKLYPTLFFEYQNIHDLTGYFADNFASEMQQSLGSFSSTPVDNNITSSVVDRVTEPVSNITSAEYAPNTSNHAGVTGANVAMQHCDTEIAIIGFDGIFPGAPDLDSLWNNLEQHVDSIREIPEDRWNWKDFYGDPLKEPNKTMSRWGGFIDDIDTFDAKFFGISPREAELMDPQQRIFLQTVWRTIEKSGYRVSDLSKLRTGLFVGVSTNDYAELMVQENSHIEAQTAIGTVHSILANRISFLLNLHGPSETVDTACSSSIVAIHRAILAMQNGECDMAIAGGVNALLSPKLFISFDKAGMLSADGRCKSFDKSADGYVRSEGVGALILKPLSRAVEDNDAIYGVIKASGVGHGGHGSSLTAPNPNAQAELIYNVYNKSNIDPATISYIEAHGTGTNLGDSIEFTALKKAFLNLYKERNRENKTACGVGSIKTNIGHMEAASGIAEVFKVLLSLQHKKIPGNVHFNEVNPFIDLENSPFYVVKDTKDWEPLKNEQGKMLPRRAGVNSFGFGGVNAHLVIEEYTQPSKTTSSTSQKQVILVSAKNRKQLQAQVKNIVDYIELKKGSLDLADLAYTLQVGREALEERFAIIVSSLDELKESLQQYLQGEKNLSEFYEGNVKANKEQTQLVIDGDEGKEFIRKIIANRKLVKLAKLWVMGINVDWKSVHNDANVRKIALPTYPFAKDRYWFESTGRRQSNVQTMLSAHPLVHANCSTLYEQAYASYLTGAEFYLKDHVVNGEMILPGVAYIEMVRAAGVLSTEQTVYKVSNILWAQPVISNTTKQEIRTGLYPADAHINFEVYSLQEDEELVHAQGKIHVAEQLPENNDIYVIDDIKQKCTKTFSAAESYELFKTKGLAYGLSFQPIKQVMFNDSMALSVMEIPANIPQPAESFMLHPSLMDGALQTAMTIIDEIVKDEKDPFLPFALGEVIIYKPVTGKCYGYVELVENNNIKKTGIIKFNIKVLDQDGHVLAALNSFTAKKYNISQLQHAAPKGKLSQQAETVVNTTAGTVSTGQSSLMYFAPEWKKADIAQVTDSLKAHMLLFDLDTSLQKQLMADNKDLSVTVVTPGKKFVAHEKDHYSINPELVADYTNLVQSLHDNQNMPVYIVFNWGKDQFEVSSSAVSSQLYKGFYSLLHVTQNLMKQKVSHAIKMVYLTYGNENEFQPVYEGLSGFAKTLQQENPKYAARMVHFRNDKAQDNGNAIAAIIRNECSHESTIAEVRYQDGQRFEKLFIETTIAETETSQPVLKDGGTYIISGGAGGLGLIISRQIAKKVKANIVLMGRSALNETKQQGIDELKAMGANVLYLQGDVSKSEDVVQCIGEVKKQYTTINGIIHSAGVIRDAYIISKTDEDVASVFAAKIFGVVHLDNATKDEDLDFFVSFSSIAAAIGNAGQVDYSFANSVLDYFSEYRNKQCQNNQRKGKTISINWPLWKEGGMHVDEQTEKWLAKRLGMHVLRTENGLKGFDDSLHFSGDQMLVIEGSRDRVNELPNIQMLDIAVVPQKEQSSNEPVAATADDIASVEREIVNLFADLLKVDAADIDVEVEVIEYGVDSIMMMSIMNRIEEEYGETIEPNSISQYPTIRSFTGYLIDQNIVKISSAKNTPVPASEKDTVNEKAPQQLAEELPKKTGNRRTRKWFYANTAGSAGGYQQSKVAVIGASCRFPQSDSIEAFWDHLKNEKTLISEVPAGRWDVSKYYSPDKDEPLKSYSKWAGFIDNIDMFDASFFDIEDGDALVLDPQHRILLELTQELFERAGFSKEEMDATSTGVFLGAGESSYVKNNLEIIPSVVQKKIIVNSIQNMMAARISDYYNLNGPSYTIDTACSSALVATHQACQSIMSKEVEMAIAGGVDLIIDPFYHIGFSKSGALSDEPVSYVFDERAKGFVLGEGAGLILLKDYDAAVRDGDAIMAVISGSAVNNDGHTMGLTVPNLEGQKKVIEKALKNSNISPDTISYLEAHGTGTLLGDPIEVKAATQVFREYTQDAQFCAIGSVKTNIGHLLHAAGISSLIKVILSLQNKQIPASLHCEHPHKRFKFESSPFFPNVATREWQPRRDIRRAAISSFGFGGTNCHMIVDEFDAAKVGSYEKKRQSLPLTIFNRKRYWLGETLQNVVADLESSNNPFYLELIESLQAGKINVTQAIELMRLSENR